MKEKIPVNSFVKECRPQRNLKVFHPQIWPCLLLAQYLQSRLDGDFTPSSSTFQTCQGTDPLHSEQERFTICWPRVHPPKRRSRTQAAVLLTVYSLKDLGNGLLGT
jgi:hypothetical protein